jgi:Xaa-Pro dipeptidase
MVEPLTTLSLTSDGCRQRQARLRQALDKLDLDAALVADRRHVHYFTGLWQRSLFSPMVLIERDGPVTLSAPAEPLAPVAADETIVYASHRLGTLVDDQWSSAYDPLRSRLGAIKMLGLDIPSPRAATANQATQDLRPTLWSLRRRKDPDEVALIHCAIAATEAAYAYARNALRPGINEVELFAGMLASIAGAIGEPIGEIGNDFQIGSLGGMPRRRPAETGEAAILDVSVVVRGYTSDLCRSFVVGGQPTDLQETAFERIVAVLQDIENNLRPDVDCRGLYQAAAAKLSGYHGWTFGHHLGHGIGLSAHEAPRLNPHWTDTLEVGDVFTIEPGLYGKDLRAGLRLEQNYHLSPTGLVRLSQFPLGLA